MKPHIRNCICVSCEDKRDQKAKPAVPRGYRTTESYNRLDVRLKLFLCDSVKARLKELAAKERM